MSGDLYSLKNITRVFGRREVLSIDSLAMEPERIYGLLGPNGSGKTTLLKIQAFLDEPTTGAVSFAGREVARRDMAPLRSQVVWSPQFPVMFTGSLRYNIEYPMRIRGLEAAARRRRSMALLERVGLADLAEAPAHRLSGGEAQRASLARALAAGAKVLLLDEPTANVDVASRQGLIDLIGKLWRDQKLSIVITTHDHGLEAELCQKRLHLRDGKLVAVDEAVIHQAALSRQGGRVLVEMPKEAGAFSGALIIKELAEHNSSILIKLVSEDRRVLTVRVSGEPDFSTARQLTLDEPLFQNGSTTARP